MRYRARIRSVGTVDYADPEASMSVGTLAIASLKSTWNNQIADLVFVWVKPRLGVS